MYIYWIQMSKVYKTKYYFLNILEKHQYCYIVIFFPKIYNNLLNFFKFIFLNIQDSVSDSGNSSMGNPSPSQDIKVREGVKKLNFS